MEKNKPGKPQGPISVRQQLGMKAVASSKPGMQSINNSGDSAQNSSVRNLLNMNGVGPAKKQNGLLAPPGGHRSQGASAENANSEFFEFNENLNLDRLSSASKHHDNVRVYQQERAKLCDPII